MPDFLPPLSRQLPRAGASTSALAPRLKFCGAEPMAVDSEVHTLHVLSLQEPSTSALRNTSRPPRWQLWAWCVYHHNWSAA